LREYSNSKIVYEIFFIFLAIFLFFT